MADTQLVGNNQLQQALLARALHITPEQQQNIIGAQQQQALAQALMQQGITPIDTSNRQIGGVGYKISPMEGVNKIVQALTGVYEQKSSNQALADALNPSSTNDNTSGQQSAPTMSGGNMWVNRDGSPTDLANIEALSGNRAGAEMVNNYSKPSLAGPIAYGTKTGESAAGLVPAGYMGPAPQAAPPQQPPPPQMGTQPPITPVQGPQQLLPAPGGQPLPNGIELPGSANASVPTSQLMPTNGQPIGSPTPPNSPQPKLPIPTPMSGTESPLNNLIPTIRAPLPGETNSQYDAYRKSAEAGATANSSKSAENLVEAQRAALAFNNQLPGIKQTVQHLIDIAPNVSYLPGMEEANHLFGDAQSGVNADFKQGLNSLKTFGTQFAATPGMGRMDLPIIQAAQGATSPEAGGNPIENKAYLNRILAQMDMREKALSGAATDMLNPSQALQNNQPSITPSPSGVTHVFVPGRGIIPVGQ